MAENSESQGKLTKFYFQHTPAWCYIQGMEQFKSRSQWMCYTELKNSIGEDLEEGIYKEKVE